MLANVELTEDFTILQQQQKALVASLLEVTGMPAVSQVTVEPTSEGHFRGFDSGSLYVVEHGTVAARYQGRTVYVLDAGDVLLPDITGNGSPQSTVFFGSDDGATLACYPALAFMRRVLEDAAAVKLWTRLLITYAGLTMRLAAARTEEESRGTPGFEVYHPGEIIIRQGDRADYVYNLSEGMAEVMVDNVVVGRIEEGEIFGAMAALTRSDRSATVVARTMTRVVKVPEAQFTDLIRSNPAMIHSLMVDMANSIVNLNEQLVALQPQDDN